jgi:hypothetical protein
MTSARNRKNDREAEKLHFISVNSFVRICVAKSVCHGQMLKQKIGGDRASGKVEGIVEQG